MTLESLLGQYHDSFLGAIMGRSALRIDGAPEKWDELISWKDLNRLLEYGGLSYPRVHLVNDGQDIPGPVYTSIGLNGYPRLMARALREAMVAGATLAIDSVDQLHEPISHLCQILEESVRVPVQADLYASTAPGSTSMLQWNDHEAFAVQVEGVTQWELHHATADRRSEGSQPPPPTGTPAWSGDLVKGQVLYIPKGWWYRDLHLEGPTLYCSLTFRSLTALDFVKRVTEYLVQRNLMTTEYPRFGRDDEQSAFLRLIQREIADVYAKPGLILGCLQESRCFCEPRLRFSLPWKWETATIMNADESVILWRIRFPGTEVLKHVETEDAVELLLDGAAVRFCGNTALLLERILDSRVSTVGGAIAACHGYLSRQEVSESLIDLMNHDVIVVRPNEERLIRSPGHMLTAT